MVGVGDGIGVENRVGLGIGHITKAIGIDTIDAIDPQNATLFHNVNLLYLSRNFISVTGSSSGKVLIEL